MSARGKPERVDSPDPGRSRQATGYDDAIPACGDLFSEGVGTLVGSVRHAELLFAGDVTDEEEHHLTAVFAGFGYQTESRRRLAHRGPDELGWLVLAALPLHAFLSGLGSEAIKDVYGGVKKLARRLSKNDVSPADKRFPLVLQDLRSDLRIVLEDDLPVEAYQQLVTLDLTAYKIGPLHYDRHRRAWRSELDEAAG